MPPKRTLPRQRQEGEKARGRPMKDIETILASDEAPDFWNTIFGQEDLDTVNSIKKDLKAAEKAKLYAKAEKLYPRISKSQLKKIIKTEGDTLAEMIRADELDTRRKLDFSETDQADESYNQFYQELEQGKRARTQQEDAQLVEELQSLARVANAQDSDADLEEKLQRVQDNANREAAQNAARNASLAAAQAMRDQRAVQKRNAENLKFAPVNQNRMALNDLSMLLHHYLAPKRSRGIQFVPFMDPKKIKPIRLPKKPMKLPLLESGVPYSAPPEYIQTIRRPRVKLPGKKIKTKPRFIYL